MNALRIYTVGHSNRTFDAFLELLGEPRVEVIVDVRRIPASGRWPQYRRAELEAALGAAGVRYVFEGEALGGKRDWTVAAARHKAIADRSFAAYASHMESEDFRAAIGRVRALARDARVALLCAEREPADCHRSYIADYLCAGGDEVVHLVRPAERLAHRLRPEARVAGRRLVYDQPMQSDLGLV